MRKMISLLLVCLLLLGSLSACGKADLVEPEESLPTESLPVETQPTEPEETQPTEPVEWVLPLSEESMYFAFYSGAGGWATEMTLHADGSFIGKFHDSNMGENDVDYPNGTMYLCNFTGRFGNVTQESDTAYRMELLEIHLEHPVDAQWIEDGVRYIAADPYGLNGGTEFVLYLPETPVEGLNEDFMMWWPYRFSGEEPLTVLSCYGIWNVAEGYGFFNSTY